MAANYYPDGNNETNQNAQNAQSGKKKIGNGWKVLLIAVLAILVVSPIDFIPGDAATVVGLADDVAYLAGIIGTIVSMVRNKSIPSGAAPTVHFKDVDSNPKK